jgi:hypothetical protein
MPRLLAVLLALALSASLLAAPPCPREGQGFELLFRPERHDGCRFTVMRNSATGRVGVFYDESMLIQEFSYTVAHSSGNSMVVHVTEIHFSKNKLSKPRPRAVDPGRAHKYMRRTYFATHDKSFLDVYEDGSGGYWIEVITIAPPELKMNHRSHTAKELVHGTR